MARPTNRARWLPDRGHTEPEPSIAHRAKVDRTALILAGAQVGANARLSAYCHIGRFVVIGENTSVHSSACIRDGAAIGRNCTIADHARIGANVIIGDDVNVGPSAYIADGCHIGNGAVIRGGSYVGLNSQVGEQAFLDATVKVAELVRIGRGSVLQPGVTVGRLGVLGEQVVVGRNAEICRNSSIGDRVRIGSCVLVAPGCTLGPDTAWHVNPLVIIGSSGMVNVPKPGFIAVKGVAKHYRIWLEVADMELPRILPSKNKPERVKEYKSYLEIAAYWMHLNGYLGEAL